VHESQLTRAERSGTPSLGFVIGRHIANLSHVDLCFRAYTSIRSFYPDSQILIVDDGSKLPDPHDYDVRTTIVEAASRGAGEFGLYAHYHATRPFERALFLHDSMVLKRRLELPDVPIVYLWHFPFWASLEVLDKDIEAFVDKLQDKDALRQKYMSREWLGMFGCASVITWECLNRAVDQYQLFRLLPDVTTRERRCVMERVLGIAFDNELDHRRPSLNGNIFEFPGLGSRGALLENPPGCMDKTWHGR
jgi:hypothetical protein